MVFEFVDTKSIVDLGIEPVESGPRCFIDWSIFVMSLPTEDAPLR